MLGDVAKVEAKLTNGSVEILDKHCFLTGLIKNNTVEVHIDSKIYKSKKIYIAQEGIFQVNTSDELSTSYLTNNETVVHLWAKQILVLSENPPFLDPEIFSAYLKKKTSLSSTTFSKISAAHTRWKNVQLENQLLFLEKALDICKEQALKI